MSAFEEALRLTLGFEGGLSSDPLDKGGLTNFGVTQHAYDRFRRRNNLNSRPVTLISGLEVMSIYRSDYWLTAHCDDLPDKLAMCVFDAAVNHGPGKAIRLLQRALNVPVDGLFGPRTKKALDIADELTTIGRFLDLRQDFYDEIIEHDPSQVRFKRGWANRVIALREALT